MKSYIYRTMEMKLILKKDAEYGTIPINYQYPVASWIYKTLHYGNPQFSEWLHEQGYSFEKRRFKLFTFSPFQFQRAKANGDRLIAQGQECSISLRFMVPDALQHFVGGCFTQQRFGIGDRISQSDFTVKTISIEQEPEFKGPMRFRAIAPVCVSKPVDFHGKFSAYYLPPDGPEFAPRLLTNLAEKYQSANPHHAAVAPEGYVKILNEPRSKLVSIKDGSPHESKIRGYCFDFEIDADPRLLRTGFYAGFGEKNSLGFGYGDLVFEKKDKI